MSSRHKGHGHNLTHKSGKLVLVNQLHCFDARCVMGERRDEKRDPTQPAMFYLETVSNAA